MIATGKNILGYSFSSQSNRIFTSFNPTNNQSTGWAFHCATADEVDQACLLATNAYRQLRSIPASQRALFLGSIAAELEQNASTILQMYVCESGLTAQRGQEEMKRTLKQLHDFECLIRENEWIDASIDEGDVTLDQPIQDIRKMRFGIGPVLVFGASNFPLAYSTAGGDTVSAFAAGCPVIVKAHPWHPATSHLVAECIFRAALTTKMPEGIFAHLFDDGWEIGKALVLNKNIKAVGFTGSLAGGRAIYDLANSRPDPIPVFAEMGSLNPLFLLDQLSESAAKTWAKKIAASITSSSGQFCTKPGLLFVFEKELAFIQELSNEIHAQSAQNMLSMQIAQRMTEKIERLNKSYPIIAQGMDSSDSSNGGVPALFLLNASDFLENQSVHDEIFGPVAIVVSCATTEEMLMCAERLSGQLTASIIGQHDSFHALNLILQEKVGRIIQNGVPTGVRVCPSMNHGGPYPASTDARYTAVGIDAIHRFSRFIAFQNFSEEQLPIELKNENQFKIRRRINGEWTRSSI